MGIYIPGMEMPKDCGHCVLCEFTTVYDAPIYECLVTGKYVDDGFQNQIMDNCPLIPVPPHGRLIDADALFKQITKDERFSVLESMYVQSLISDAPTIIPAEEGPSNG